MFELLLLIPITLGIFGLLYVLCFHPAFGEDGSACTIQRIEPKSEHYSDIFRVVGAVDFYFDKDGRFDGVGFRSEEKGMAKQLVDLIYRKKPNLDPSRRLYKKKYEVERKVES